MTNKFSELNRELNKHSINIIFVSDADLRYLFQSYYNLTTNIKIAITAELLTRFWLFNSNYNVEYIYDLISEEMINDFWNLTKQYREKSQETLPQNLELPFNKEINKKVYSSINRYLTCDGIIPVIKNKIAYALPFNLLNDGNLDNMIVEDIKNHKVQNWTNYINELRSYGINSWKIQIQVEIDEDNSFDGNSLELPVLMGIERKEGRLNYSPLDVLATGSLALGGTITNVEGITEKLDLAKKLKSKICFIPEQENMRIDSVVQISKGTNIKKSIQFIKNNLVDKGLDNLTWREAKSKIKELENDVHYGVVSLKQTALAKVEFYEKLFHDNQRKEELLNAKALKAAIYCHLGKTKEAQNLNNECLNLAQKYNCHKVYAEIAIRQIVNLTDLGDFENSIRQSEYLENMINSANIIQSDKSELLMRLHGTFGQAIIYNNLSKNCCDSRNNALEHLNKAAEFAKNSDVISNICQNLNYIHL